jgi:hypothetical protein
MGLTILFQHRGRGRGTARCSLAFGSRQQGNGFRRIICVPGQWGPLTSRARALESPNEKKKKKGEQSPGWMGALPQISLPRALSHAASSSDFAFIRISCSFPTCCGFRDWLRKGSANARSALVSGGEEQASARFRTAGNPTERVARLASFAAPDAKRSLLDGCSENPESSSNAGECLTRKCPE